MQIVGITGGIGSGKSTIAQALRQRGFSVYDCDEEAKRIIVEDEAVRKAIVGLLGEEAYIYHLSSIIYKFPIYNLQSMPKAKYSLFIIHYSFKASAAKYQTSRFDYLSFIESNPCPNTPIVCVSLTNALGSIARTSRNIRVDSFLRAITVTTFMSLPV